MDLELIKNSFAKRIPGQIILDGQVRDTGGSRQGRERDFQIEEYMQTEHFQGKDGYIWWHGVVEDRKDPMFLGRCRVRILGWHTADKAELPTADLPWAYPLMPITSASQVGVGEAPIVPAEGTRVMGYYRVGDLAHEPVIVGTLPGNPENLAKQNTRLNDFRLDTTDTHQNIHE